MLTSAEITSMVTVIATTLPETCVIKRPTLTSDNKGGNTKSLSTIATVNGAFFADTKASDVVTGEKFQVVSNWIILLPYNQDVSEKDIIIIGSRNFEVLTSEFESYRLLTKVVCKEIK